MSQTSSSDDAFPSSAHRAYKTKPCRFYARGKCTAGDSCRWSHDENMIAENDGVDNEFVPGGYKLVPKSYRTLPCARFQLGHCFYGDECNFIHATPQPSTASTPPPLEARKLDPSPPQLIHKAHSTHHSPAISPLNAPAIRSSISASTPPSATIGAVLSAPTRPRELPPPQSQTHYSGINWSIPAVGTPGTPAKGGAGTPVFASSPLITANSEWAQPAISRSNSLQPQDAVIGPNGVQNHVPPHMRSPFLLTFGEIGPNGASSVTNSPRGLGLNGANLTAVGAVSTSNGPIGIGLPSVTSGTRLGSPAIGSGSALGTTGIIMGRQKSRLSTSADMPEDNSGHEADAETEPDFPSISYSDLNDLVTDVDDREQHPPNDFDLHQDVTNALRNGPGGEFASSKSFGVTNGQAGVVNGTPQFNPHANGAAGDAMPYGPNGSYENDWGRALHMLQAPPSSHGQAFPHQSEHFPNGNGYGDQGFRSGYKTRPCKYYVVGSRCPSGQNCTFIHDPEAMRSGTTVYSPPNKLGGEKHPLYRTRECKYHLAGRCHQEQSCDFKHTGPPGQGREYENWEGFSITVREHEVAPEERPMYRSRPCRWFMKGNCFHGDNCTYSHDLQHFRPPCHFFRNGTGHCIAGDNCRFSHDIMPADEGGSYHSPIDDTYPLAQDQPPTTQPEPANDTVMPQAISVYPAEEEPQEYNEPYFVGMGGLMNGDGLTVQPQRMELVVSEGEDEEEEEDIVIMKAGLSMRNEANNQDVEKLFASLSVAGAS
ncbi:hypothetical protein FRB99_003696 [Tulasnella sp. 403]|nr:hypothetical protein FRB99_003696 [Tulasnella sp. 403]